MAARTSSLVHPKYKTQYSIKNGSEYEQGLRDRGVGSFDCSDIPGAVLWALDSCWADKRKQGLTTMAARTVPPYGCYVNPSAGAGRRATTPVCLTAV